MPDNETHETNNAPPLTEAQAESVLLLMHGIVDLFQDVIAQLEAETHNERE